jgi:hypothetical protein
LNENFLDNEEIELIKDDEDIKISILKDNFQTFPNKKINK